jgi:hypothetical protein
MPTLDQPNIDRLKPAPALPATSAAASAATPTAPTAPAAQPRAATTQDRPLPTLDNPSVDRANPGAARSAPAASAGRDPVPGINAPGRSTDAPRAGGRALPTLTDPRGTGASPANVANPTAAPRSASGLPAWWVEKPTIDEGVVRVSASGDAANERDARRLALEAARRRLTQALGFAPAGTETERIEVLTLPSGSVRVLVLVSASAKP